MKTKALVGWGFGLLAVGAICGLWAQQTYVHAEGVGYYSAGFEGDSIGSAEQAGMAAGYQAATVPIVLTVVALLVALTFLLVSVVRRPS